MAASDDLFPIAEEFTPGRSLAPRPVFQTGAPTGDPPVLGRARTETRSVTMRLELTGGSLSVWSRGDDGNFTVPLRVTCREAEGSGPGPWSRDFYLEAEGWHVEAEGLGEANGQRLRSYINARRNGPPDAQGLADLCEVARLSPARWCTPRPGAMIKNASASVSFTRPPPARIFTILF